MFWPEDEEEVLYPSPEAVFKEGKAIRGVIPVCWPWFNAHPTNPEMPSHGIARTRFWELVEADESENGVVLKFEMSEGIWHASVTVKAGEELKVILETRNPNEVPIVVAGALHSYFAGSDIGQVRVVNLECSEFLDTTTEPPVRRKQKGAVDFDREVNAICDSSNSLLLVDDHSGRTLLIEKSGNPSTVVWNPWEEKAAALGDLPDEGYRKVCCVESAIANDRAEIVMPGGSHVLMTRISVEE